MVKNARREDRGKGIKQVKRKREGKRCVEYREQVGQVKEGVKGRQMKGKKKRKIDGMNYKESLKKWF